MVAARSLTAFVGIAGVVGAYYVVDILHMLTQSYEVLVCTTLVPVLICLTPLPRIRAAATAAVTAGAVSFCVVTMWGTFCGMPRPLACLAVSLAAYTLVTFYTLLVSKRS